jgi:hypothetical protein
MASIFQDETKMHYIIIGILSLSIILLLTHIKQMQSKKAPAAAVAPMMRRRVGPKEGFAATQLTMPTLSGTLQMSTPTDTYDRLIAASSEDSIDALKNPLVGCQDPNVECPTGGVF